MFFLVASLEAYGRLFVEKTIRPQSPDEVHKEVVDAAMAGMFNVADIFQFIINSLNNRAFSEHNFIEKRHQAVFHIGF